MADLVILRHFNAPHEAEIARGLLESEGIKAVVVESARNDPLFNQAVGVVLRVFEDDFEHADALLRAAQDDGNPDPGGADVVRCPRCELELCWYGYPRVLAPAGLFALLPALVNRLFGRKRWRCGKCAHVWDDPKEGPAIPSRFAPDDPRPTFLLVRRRSGMGAFLGLVVGWLVMIIGQGMMSAALFVGPVLGFFVGRMWTFGVCSDADCRAPLAGNDETCPRCKKTVAGTITRASDHYAELAAVRRELTARRERKKKRKRKKETT